MAGACLAIAAVAAGCGSSGNSGSTTSTHASGNSGKHVQLAFLDAAASTYGLAMQNQGQKTAQSDNASIITQNANFDPQQQLSQCKNLVAQHSVQGLVVYAVDNASMIPCVTAAKAAGVKIASVEGQIGPKLCTPTGHQVPGITLEVYTCAAQTAVYWAHLINQACANKNPCNVAMFSGQESLAIVPPEMSALTAALKQYPNTKLIAHYTPGFDEPAAAAADARTLMLAHPNTNVIVEDDDSSLGGVVQAMKQLGKTNSVKLIGTGGSSEAIARIKAGTQFGTVISTPQTDMQVAVKDLIAAIRGQNLSQTEIPSSQISPLGKNVWAVTKANADQFTPQWS